MRCLNSKLPYKGVPVDFPPFYGTLNENELLMAQQIKRAIPVFTVYYHGIPLLAKVRCINSKLPNKGIPVDFPPVYGN